MNETAKRAILRQVLTDFEDAYPVLSLQLEDLRKSFDDHELTGLLVMVVEAMGYRDSGLLDECPNEGTISVRIP